LNFQDALKIKDSSSQYEVYSIERELNKAYCGFKTVLAPNIPVATGYRQLILSKFSVLGAVERLRVMSN
jgi:hypothetical protein